MLLDFQLNINNFGKYGILSTETNFSKKENRFIFAHGNRADKITSIFAMRNRFKSNFYREIDKGAIFNCSIKSTIQNIFTRYHEYIDGCIATEIQNES